MSDTDQPLTAGKILGRSDFKNQGKAKHFVYRKPEEIKSRRALVPIVRSDIMMAMIQVIKEGGEQSLHAHSNLDGFWFVLGGRARFYGERDELIAELGKHEGVYIPREYPYWFEAVGGEPLELLQVEASDKTVKPEYRDYSNKKLEQGPSEVDFFESDGKLIARDVRLGA